MKRDAFKQVFASIKKIERKTFSFCVVRLSINGKDYEIRPYLAEGELFYQEAYGILSYIDDTNESHFDVESIDRLSISTRIS